jgi:uncharacterized protein (TIGR03083 family)
VDDTSGDVRASFRCAVAGFLSIVEAVPPGRFSETGLGSWSVRDLIGHTSRAMATIEEYCGRSGDGPPVSGPAQYFARVGQAPPGSDARRQRDAMITERGREAGASLGEDPVAAVSALAERVVAFVAASADDTPVASAAGQMTLAGYLPTRTFELVVHSLDLTVALGLVVPEVMKPAIAASMMLAAQIAADMPSAPEVLLALCGRRVLPEGFTVV